MGEPLYLLIPPSGLLEVFQTEKQIDVEETLRRRCEDCEGNFMSLNLGGGWIEWIVPKQFEDFGPINERAEAALAMLVGMHMILPGHVMIRGVDPELTFKIVAELSRKE